MTNETKNHNVAENPTVAMLEAGLIIAGLIILLFATPHEIYSDDLQRFKALSELLTQGKISDIPYSMVGPLFSAPLWLLGKLCQTPAWWCARYNFFLFAGGILLMYFMLRRHLCGTILRRFLLILIFGSMFPHHQTWYYGEVFTAVLVGIGILAVCVHNSFWGWCCLVIGVVNTPASAVALLLVVGVKAVQDKKLRDLIALVAANIVLKK